MSTVAANDAKETLAELVRKSEAGDDPVIVNRGEPLAHLVPAQANYDIEQARLALQRIRERAKGMNLKVTPEEIKSWIEEGRP